MDHVSVCSAVDARRTDTHTCDAESITPSIDAGWNKLQIDYTLTRGHGLPFLAPSRCRSFL